MDNRVKVAVRIRPLIGIELNSGALKSVTQRDNRSVTVNLPNRKTFDYDWVFGLDADQKHIYQQLCNPLIENIFKGVNATVFAYGQTGSGDHIAYLFVT